MKSVKSFFDFVLVVALLTTGCLFNKKTIKQADVGSVQVSVQFVAPWEEYVESLTPKFKLATADEALAKVIPSTLLSDEALLEGMGASLRFAPPGTGIDQTTEVKENSEGEISSSNTSKETTQSGVLSAAQSASVVGDRKAAALLKQSSGNTLNQEPVLQYLAALALYQEVQLLNRYLEDAAFRYKYRSYIVRLQVSIIPYRREQPIDAHTNLSFFTRQSSKPLSNAAPPVVSVYALNLETVKRLRQDSVIIDKNADIQVKDVQAKLFSPKYIHNAFIMSDQKTLTAMLQDAVTTTKIDQGENSDVPYVLPLLVTDNLEASLQSRAIDKIYQFALGVNLLLKGFAGTADFQKFSEKFNSVYGKEVNSLMTVARASGNTLRVRFGAQYVPELKNHYAMIPRTHNVTAVLLLPKSFADLSAQGKIDVISHTRMMNVRTNKFLEQRSDKDITQEIYAAMKSYVPPIDKKKKEVIAEIANFGNSLLQDVQQNDFENFNIHLKKLILAGAQNNNSRDEILLYNTSIWAELVRVMEGSLFQSVSFQIPPSTTPKILGEEPIAANPPAANSGAFVVLDDGENNSTVALNGSSGLVTSRLNVILEIEKKPANPPAAQLNNFKLITEEVKLDGNTLRLKFPSLKLLGLPNNENQFEKINLNITMAKDPWETSAEQKWIFNSYLYKIKGEKPNAGFELTGSSQIIVNSTGDGKFFLTVTIKDATKLDEIKPIIVEATSGGVLTSITSFGGQQVDASIAEFKDGKISINQGITLKVNVDDIFPGTPLNLKAVNKKKVSQEFKLDTKILPTTKEGAPK